MAKMLQVKVQTISKILFIHIMKINQSIILLSLILFIKTTPAKSQTIRYFLGNIQPGLVYSDIPNEVIDTTNEIKAKLVQQQNGYELKVYTPYTMWDYIHIMLYNQDGYRINEYYNNKLPENGNEMIIPITIKEHNQEADLMRIEINNIATYFKILKRETKP